MIEFDDVTPADYRPVPERVQRNYAGQDIVERVFKDSFNDYQTVLAIARRARQILEDYPKYEARLEVETATSLALDEFLAGRFKLVEEETETPAR